MDASQAFATLRAARLGFAVAGWVLTAAAALPAGAQVLTSGVTLPLELAHTAAREAIRACEADGHRVSASVVDAAGVERAFLRGDHSTIHTRDTAFRKAYTAVTLGPIFGAATTGALAEKVGRTPTGPALASVPNVILLAGGVAIRRGEETLAALGVGGAPGGALDERCASAGVAAIQARVEALGRP
ncbi:GlcG/HbpS family heme-binding protein [Derxia gummosa]|uniref:GlcG/HbpS family heme-binding protein n=1 Tax=Derxia gummosa DSM 723 TaxID=1121388 RepID=A0A8B6X9E0_9BURK|nr:heme-binding protein [Derxia gummosa]